MAVVDETDALGDLFFSNVFGCLEAYFFFEDGV